MQVAEQVAHTDQAETMLEIKPLEVWAAVAAVIVVARKHIWTLQDMVLVAEVLFIQTVIEAVTVVPVS
jgi:hypothetical protein